MSLGTLEHNKENRSAAAILLADGEAFMRQVIGNALTIGGFRNIHPFNQVSDLQEALAGAFPDLLILDSDLPGGDAVELVREIRRHNMGRNPYLPIIMTSWDAAQMRVRQALDSGVDALLVKPFAADQLFARIDNLVLDRKPFVVTTDYVGPDRRKQPRQDDKTSPREEPAYFVVPNTLKQKLEGRAVNLARLMEEISDLTGQMRESRVLSTAGAIVGLVNEIEIVHAEAGPPEDIKAKIERLIEVDEIFVDHVIGTRFETLHRPASTLIEALRKIASHAEPFTSRQLETVKGLADSIRAGVDAGATAATALTATAETAETAALV